MTVDLDYVRAAVDAGICVVPPAEDGTKRPDGDWKRFQAERPDEPQLRAWFNRGRDGIGFICGQISGGLEMLEFEGRAVDAGMLGQYEDAAIAAGIGDLLERVCQGYFEVTPSGGVHLLYRCPTPLGNTKLARRPANAAELADNPDDRIKVLIETRGEGGYVIVAPSQGRVHPDGGAWAQVHGGVDTIANITDEERDALFAVARSFDSMPVQRWTPHTPVHRTAEGDGPADHYNAAITWPELLEPAGWTRVYERDRATYWCRPGKQRGISASTNHDGFDLLHVFTSSTVFEPERSYTKFHAYAILHHDGDLSAAGKQLYRDGYGTRRDTPKAPPVTNRTGSGPWDDPIPDEAYNTQPGTPRPSTAAPVFEAVNEERELLKVTISIAGQRALTPGGTFILDAPEKVESVWGDGDAVAWASGEPLMINGPTGVGKTTIAQQVVLGRIGLRPTVLDMTVTPTTKRVLYIAADRPKQAARSFRRMVTEADRELLDDRLEVWKGPLPQELTKQPEILVVMADHYGADTIIIDSLKDVVAKLSDDESANRANNAFQACSANDIELLVLHHQRKAQAENRKPNSINDVFGSTWLTAGMGSVLLVWGQPGDPVVEITHLKQPGEPVGPLTVVHDHDQGYSTVEPGVDLLTAIRHSHGLTADAIAGMLYKTENPKKADVEKARRKVNRLVNEGLVVAQDGGKSVTGQQMAIRYYAVERAPKGAA